MSSATAHIYDSEGNGPIAYSVYHGTSDCQPRFLSPSSEQAWKDRDTVDGWRDYCGCVGVAAIIHTCYGGGWEWAGRVCLDHMLIIDGDGCYESNLAEVWHRCENPRPGVGPASIMRASHSRDRRCLNAECGLFHDNACKRRHPSDDSQGKGKDR